MVSLVTSLSIGKSDDASSVADSAISTSIATCTDQVSQYSEVGDKMTSYIVIIAHWLSRYRDKCLSDGMSEGIVGD